MRAWIVFLAVLATFQAIVQVASTDTVGMRLTSSASSNHKSKHHRRRTWSSPTLTFAAIVAAPAESDLSLTNLNNIVLNSDNVRHPEPIRSEEEARHQQLLVPTNFSTVRDESFLSSSASANAVVNTSRSSQQNSLDNSVSSSSGSSNRINSDQIGPRYDTGASKRRHRKRAQKEQHRRRQQQQSIKNRTWESNSVHAAVDGRISSNELNREVVTEEDVEEEEELQQEERVKPDPETLVTIEKNLLSLFGFKTRPKIDRSKVVIPEAMRRMYAETTGMELDLPDDLPKPQVRAHQTANTVRSFTHEGESRFKSFSSRLNFLNCRCESVLHLSPHPLTLANRKNVLHFNLLAPDKKISSTNPSFHFYGKLATIRIIIDCLRGKANLAHIESDLQTSGGGGVGCSSKYD